MPRVVEHYCEAHLVQGVSEGDIVRCGPAGAAWSVFSRDDNAGVAKFTLHPVDAHDVPLDATVVELPLPQR